MLLEVLGIIHKAENNDDRSNLFHRLAKDLLNVCKEVDSKSLLKWIRYINDNQLFQHDYF